MNLKKINSALKAGLFLLGWAFIKFLPAKLSERLFDFIGKQLGKNAKSTAQLRKNLARVTGVTPEKVPLEMLIKSMQSYARYWREVFCLPNYSISELADDISKNAYSSPILAKAIARNKGVIMALPHSGNWEMAGIYLVQYFSNFTTVAEKLEPQILFNKFVKYRESLGFEIIPLTKDSQPYEVLKQRLLEGKLVCLLGDRDLTNSGIPVNFFGETAYFPAGPAKLAQETGATLLPVHCWVENGENFVNAFEEIEISDNINDMTQKLANTFEKNIRDHPTDWHMLQALWESDLDNNRRNKKS